MAIKLYCYVENASVVSGPQVLGPQLADKSDFELLDLGWYYAECIRPESFVDRYEVFLPIQFDIQPRKVVCTYTKRDKTPEELAAQDAEKQAEVEADKADRLTFAGTFMNSPAYQALPVATQNEWVVYVQQVTDTPTSGEGVDVWNVYFPSQPPTSYRPQPSING